MKSCYKAIVHDFSREDIKDWTKIWMIKISPKAKMLIWQACTRSLSTTAALNQRKVDGPIQCQICYEDEESIMHVFISSEVAKQCWNIFTCVQCPNVAQSFEDWFMHDMSQMNDDNRCLFVVMCCRIWMARNDKVWRNKSVQGKTIIESAKIYLQEWRAMMDGGNGRTTGETESKLVQAESCCRP